MRSVMPTSPSRVDALRKRLKDGWLSKISQFVPSALRRHWVDYAFIIAFIVLIAVTASTSDVFFTQRNISNLLRQIVPNGLISLGMLVVILTGGIDLSVGSIVALAGILATGLQADMPLSAAIAVALVAGTAAGAFNGVLVARFKLAPFIVTLATLGGLRGFVYVYSDTPQSPVNPDFRQILGGSLGGIAGQLALATVIMVACYPIVWLFLNRTPAGRAIYAIGGNEEAVRLAGIPVERSRRTVAPAPTRRATIPTSTYSTERFLSGSTGARSANPRRRSASRQRGGRNAGRLPNELPYRVIVMDRRSLHRLPRIGANRSP